MNDAASTPTATDTGSAPVSTVNDAAAALAFADSSLATPETPTDSTPAAAVVQPVESPVPGSVPDGVDDPRSPFIPRARFDEVIAARTKAEEALKQYDWAKDFQPDEVQNVAQLSRALKTDAVGTVLQLLSQLEASPEHAAALRSHAARTLGARRAPEPASETAPEPDLQAPDGTLVYSAAQMQKRMEFDRKQIIQQFKDELQPLVKDREAAQAERSHTAYVQTTASAVNDLRASDPDFAAHTKDVYAALEADADLMRMALGDDKTPANPKLAIRAAWNEVYRSKVVPQRLKDSEGKTLSNLQQRAVIGATTPTGASTSTPKTVLGDARAALEFANSQLGA